MDTRVKVNQLWKNKQLPDRTRIRILANHPDGGYIIYDSYQLRDRYYRLLHRNLMEHYVLVADVCEHRHTEDSYAADSPVPTHYYCTDCGDLFPNTGDTDLWFPKVIVKDNTNG